MSEKKAWGLTWVFAILPLLGWWLYGLFDLDEGFYGAVVAEMNRRGEWITPFYNGKPWFEKPILLYWLAKPCLILFGDWWGPRIPSILATVATYALIAWFARRHWGDAAGRISVLVAATSLLVVALGRMMMTDSVLAFCLAGAMIFFYESIAGEPKWRILAGLFLGLSVLAKGPVGILLFVPIAAVTYWRCHDLRSGFRGYWMLGTIVFLGVIASWYLPAYVANGDLFVQKFLIEQNLNRFTGGDAAHTVGGFGYLMYIPVLLVGMAPWSFYLYGAARQGKTSLDVYLLIWAAVPFLFFTVGKAKLPHYVLPCCVPIALIVGRHLAERRVRFFSPAAVAVVVALLANVGFWLYYNRFSGHAEVHRIAIYVRDHLSAGEEATVYQMGRREKSLGTGKMKIQETSHPSLPMYLDRVVNESETVDDLLSDSHPQWVITRWNRVTEEDVALVRASGRHLERIDLATDLYALYKLSGR